MSTRHYTLPVEQTEWRIPGCDAETVFNWDYDGGRDRLLALYEKGKDKQWNASHRIDWSVDVDPDDPLGSPEYTVPIYGSKVWDKLDAKGRATFKHHMTSWQFSQFLHGEQGALICAAKIVQCVPQLDAKFYAATQVIDEARHVEIYSRFLNEKLKLAYPVNPHLGTLLGQVVSDSRWDLTNLGMQVIIEGLALAAFGVVRDISTNSLAKSLTAYVMQDEARHVAFGRMALREFYPQLSDGERNEREEFVVEACYLMRDRFLAEEVFDRLGFDKKECLEFVTTSHTMRNFRKMLFMRIVPTIKDIGLWGPKVRAAFEDMDVMAFAELDAGAMSADDERAGDAYDELRLAQSAKETEKVIALGAAE